MLRFNFCLFSLLFSLSFLAQNSNLITDGSFDEIMFHHSEANQQNWDKGFWVHYNMKKEAIQRPNSYANQNNILQLNFRVSSSRVDDNFISTKLNQPLKTGKQYKISFLVAKDKFSGYPIKEINAFFTTSIPHQNYHKTHQMKNAILEFSLDEVNSEWISLSMNYTAYGGEQYFHIGSLGQTFNIKESLKYGLMGADATYNQNIYNSVYYIDDVVLELNEKTQVDSITQLNFLSNPIDYFHHNKNLLLNSGLEEKVEKVYYTEAYVTPGGMIAPYVYSVNNFEPRLHQTDSNAYRSEYGKEELPYMGNSMLSFKAYSTNKHHVYQEVLHKQKGQDYDTWYYYERMPSSTNIPKYEKGSTICLPLKDYLKKDSVYYFSFMLKLDDGSSYGLDFLGFHALNEFPANTNDSIWKRVPDEIIPVEDLLSNSNWMEKQIRYQAKGGERFVALSAVYPKLNIYKNQNFSPEVSETCGPNSYNCFNRNVYYRDSLFANYYLDNMVMLSENDWVSNASKIFENVTNQIEVMYLPMEREGEWKDQKLLNAQNALIGILEVLRTNDAICVLNENKNDPLILEPFSIINKRKIIRKLNQPKLVRKVRNYELDPSRIYFSGDPTPQYNNHLMIVTDGNIDFSALEIKLQTFCKNGGYFTLIYTGATDIFQVFIEKNNIFHNNLVIDASDEKLQEKLYKRILKVN
jgi:hypothetical protein